VRTLSDLALRSSQAENSDEVWLVLLTIDHDDILDGPLRFVNDMQNLIVAPENDIDETDLTAWSQNSTTTEAIGSSFRVTDTTTGASGYINNYPTGASPNTGTITEYVQIKKDRVGKATRFAALVFNDGVGSTWVCVDTSNGDYSVEHLTGGTGLSGGVIDTGNSLFVYACRSSVADTNMQIYPAYGSGTLGFASGIGTPAGSIIVERFGIFNGDPDDLLTYIAFPFQLDLPGEDQDAASPARLRIDNVDRQIVEAIRGLSGPPTANLEVVLASQPETVEIGFYDLTIRSADYDAMVIEAAMTYEAIFTEPVSFDMTPSRFPGLY
jgi:hypothetical protein